MGFPDAAFNRVALPLFDLGQQQCFQIPNVALLLANRLLGERAELRGDHRHPQSLALSSWSYSSITGRGRAYRSSAPTSMASHSACRRSSAFNK
jgi:hypothetical protein